MANRASETEMAGAKSSMSDDHPPGEVAKLLDTLSASKVTAPFTATLGSAGLAGAFIALGGIFATVIATQSGLGFGTTRLLAGVGFSLGLILVVVAGAELFTGNNLMVISLATRRISPLQLLRNWSIVFVGNFIGALIIVGVAFMSRWWEQGDIGATALATAHHKVNLSWWAIFFSGILANTMVCLATWMASSARTVFGKVIAVVFPVAAFVAAGFEHSVANMYFLPMGLLLSTFPEVVEAAGLSGETARLTLPWAGHNLLFTTLGNIVGGGGFVGMTYWFTHLRSDTSDF